MSEHAAAPVGNPGRVAGKKTKGEPTKARKVRRVIRLLCADGGRRYLKRNERVGRVGGLLGGVGAGGGWGVRSEPITDKK